LIHFYKRYLIVDWHRFICLTLDVTPLSDPSLRRITKIAA